MRSALAAILVLAWAPAAAQAPLSQCFPVEKLDNETRRLAEDLLLRALDREALYTFIGGIKPMSNGFATKRIDVDAPKTDDLEKTRKALRAIRCGDEIVCAVQPYWNVYEGKRYLDAGVFHRQSMAKAIETHRSFFAFYGITPSSEPIEAVMAIDRDDTSRRNRAYGYFFGYPKYAVDFFVNAENERRRTKKLVPRDFFSIPVFAGPTNFFVWAVPKGSQPTEQDLKLKAKCEKILDYYKRLREKYIGEGKKGVIALIRDWYGDGKGNYSPTIAYRKVFPNEDPGKP